MDTKLLHVSEVPVSTGLPKGVTNPIKPERFAGKHEGRLAKAVGLTQFGVNHVTLEPGSISALRHWHQVEDEFVYVLSGRLTLVDENGEHVMEAGSFAGFPAGVPERPPPDQRVERARRVHRRGIAQNGEETVHYPDDPLGPVRI